MTLVTTLGLWSTQRAKVNAKHVCAVSGMIFYFSNFVENYDHFVYHYCYRWIKFDLSFSYFSFIFNSVELLLKTE